MKYYVNVKDMNKVISQIQKDSDKALYSCGLYLERKLKEEVRKDSYDEGNLLRSINTQKVKNGLVVVGTNLEYAIVREEGRRPGKFPPLQALVGRSARKGMIKGGKTSRYEDLHYSDRGVIFVIARAIARRGIQGKHTFQNVIEKERENISNLYVEELRKG